MLRRLYFLFPDEKHAQHAVDQLINRKIPKCRIHAISQGIKLTTLPEATERQKNDSVSQIEQFLWIANLLLFTAALIVLIASIASAEWFWSGLSLAAMLTTFFAGKYFIEHVPNDHLTEFTSALAHGEILLMIDVPIYRVTETVSFVEHHYPDTTLDGTSWTMDAFGI